MFLFVALCALFSLLLAPHHAATKWKGEDTITIDASNPATTLESETLKERVREQYFLHKLKSPSLLRLVNLPQGAIEETLDSFGIDHNRKVRGILVSVLRTETAQSPTTTYRNQATDKYICCDSLGLEIDAYLMPRPWWFIPAHGELRTNSTHYEVELHRFQIHGEKNHVLRDFSQWQYPDERSCSSRSMIVGVTSAVHPGWGSVAWSYYLNHNNYMHSTRAIWFNTASLSFNSFISPEDCPYDNEWNCAFLPATNCSVPESITKCKELHAATRDAAQNACVRQRKGKGEKNGKYAGMLMSSKDFSSFCKKMKDEGGGPALTCGTPNSNFDIIASAGSVEGYVLSASVIDKYTHKNRKKSLFAVDDVGDVPYIFQYMLRASTFYRARIDDLQNHFYSLPVPPTSRSSISNSNSTSTTTTTTKSSSKEPQLLVDATASFGPSSRCVAAHMRRGDRGVGDKIDVYEYCYNHSVGLQCQSRFRKDKEISMELCVADVCGGTKPFASITLADVVNQSEQLVDKRVNTIIVFTDDIPWLRDQIVKLIGSNDINQKAWNVLYMRGPKTMRQEQAWLNREALEEEDLHDPVFSHEIEGATDSTDMGVFFHASLSLARQCEAFVGHFGSQSTSLFYKSMCHSHRDSSSDTWVTNECPPKFDLQDL